MRPPSCFIKQTYVSTSKRLDIVPSPTWEWKTSKIIVEICHQTVLLSIVEWNLNMAKASLPLWEVYHGLHLLPCFLSDPFLSTRQSRLPFTGIQHFFGSYKLPSDKGGGPLPCIKVTKFLLWEVAVLLSAQPIDPLLFLVTMNLRPFRVQPWPSKFINPWKIYCDQFTFTRCYIC